MEREMERDGEEEGRGGGKSIRPPRVPTPLPALSTFECKFKSTFKCKCKCTLNDYIYASFLMGHMGEGVLLPFVFGRGGYSAGQLRNSGRIRSGLLGQGGGQFSRASLLPCL